MMFEVEIMPAAEEEIAKLDKLLQERVLKIIEDKLERADALPSRGRLKGAPLGHIRVNGGYRIIYRIVGPTKIEVIFAGSHKKAERLYRV